MNKLTIILIGIIGIILMINLDKLVGVFMIIVFGITALLMAVAMVLGTLRKQR